jgi:hypothetical protein
MSRDIVDRSFKTCRTLVVGLVGAFGVDAVLGDEFSVAGEDAHVAVVDGGRRGVCRFGGGVVGGSGSCPLLGSVLRTEKIVSSTRA